MPTSEEKIIALQELIAKVLVSDGILCLSEILICLVCGTYISIKSVEELHWSIFTSYQSFGYFPLQTHLYLHLRQITFNFIVLPMHDELN